jgi:hypothetical protein
VRGTIVRSLVSAPNRAKSRVCARLYNFFWYGLIKWAQSLRIMNCEGYEMKWKWPTWRQCDKWDWFRVYPNLFLWRNPSRNFSYPEQLLSTIYENAQEPEKADSTEHNLITVKLLSSKLVKSWVFVSSTLFLHIKTSNCSSTANRWTKILAIFQGKFGIFRDNSKFIFVHYTISRKPPNGLLRKPSLEKVDWGKNYGTCQPG